MCCHQLLRNTRFLSFTLLLVYALLSLVQPLIFTHQCLNEPGSQTNAFNSQRNDLKWIILYLSRNWFCTETDGVMWGVFSAMENAVGMIPNWMCPFVTTVSFVVLLDPSQGEAAVNLYWLKQWDKKKPREDIFKASFAASMRNNTGRRDIQNNYWETKNMFCFLFYFVLPVFFLSQGVLP